VSSFRTEARALEDLAQYEKIGYRGVIVTVELAGRGTWRRVLLGPYPTVEEARQVAEAVKEDALAPDAMVLKVVP
jgi:hypothetical protein